MNLSKYYFLMLVLRKLKDFFIWKDIHNAPIKAEKTKVRDFVFEIKVIENLAGNDSL